MGPGGIVMDRPMRCLRCGDVIGYYEPLMLVAQGQEQLTSAAADPQIAERRGALFHHACYVTAQKASDTPWRAST
jgi:hypothetical protein